MPVNAFLYSHRRLGEAISIKRVMYIGVVGLLCLLSVFGAAKLTLGLTGSAEIATVASLAAFIGNLFIAPIQSPVIK